MVKILKANKSIKICLIFIFLFCFSFNYNIKEYSYLDFIKKGEISEDNVEGGITYKISYERGQITQNYLGILAEPKIDDSLFIYYSPISEKREDAYLLNSGKDEIALYINKIFTKSEADGIIYLTIACFSKECSFIFSILELDEINLPRNGQYTYFTTNKKNTENIFKIIRAEEKEEEGNLTFWATGSKDITMNVKYVNEYEGKEIIIPKIFQLENGKYTFIYEKDFPIDSKINYSLYYFIIEIISPENSLITVGSNLNLNTVSKNDNDKLTVYSPNSKEIYGIVNNNSTKQCFDFLIDSAQIYYLSVLDFKRNVNIQKLNQNGEELENYDIKEGKILITILNETQGNYYCVNKKNDDDIDASFSLQVTYDIDNNYYKNIYSPQINGFFYERFLKKGQFAFYTCLPSIKYKTELRYYLKINSGYPQMYFAKCDSFPYCEFDIDDLPSGTIKINKINDMFSYSIYKTEITNAISPDQYVLLVVCSNDEDCSFETNFYSELDTFILPKDKKIYQTIMNQGQNNIVIKLDGEHYYDEIFVDFLTYSGDISIKYKQKGLKIREYNAGNKQYFVIDEINNNEIYFYVTGKMASYYSVNYKLIYFERNKKNMKEESGISYLETIEPKFGHKTVSLTNKRKDNKRNFLVNFFSLNCEISITRKINQTEKKLETIDYLSQDIILNNEEEYNSEKYDYDMEIIKMDNVTTFETNWCMVYVSSIENNLENDDIYKNRQLLVSEGVINRIILNENYPKIEFIYPHINPTGYVIINLNIGTNPKLNIKINIENKTYKEITTSKSQYFIIEESVLRSDDYCPLINTRPNQVCNIIIEITLNSTFYKEEPIIELNIKSKEEIPSYIRKSMLRRDVITGNYNQYFFTDIGPKEEGNITINFYYGNGNVYGRIVSKNENEGSGWMDKYILPNEENNELKYDYYSQKMYYNSKNTEKCNYGCYLFLNVEPDFSDDYYKKENIAYPLSLYINSNHASSLTSQDLLNTRDIPINEYIIGDTIPFTNRFNDFYTFWIPYDCEEIIFEFMGDSTYIFINIGNRKPTLENSDFKLKELGDNNILRITKNEILQKINWEETTIKNIQLTIAIGAEYIDNDNSSFYSFRIRALREYEIELIPLTNEQKILCDIKGQKGNCYFLLPYNNEIDEQINFFFHVLDLPNVDFNYYAYNIDKDIIDNRDNDTIIEIISNKDKADWSSKSSKGNYLYIDNSEINDKENGIYILLNIYVNAPTKKEDEKTIISLLHTVYSYNGMILPNLSTYQLFMVNKNNLNELYLDYSPNNQNLIIHITLISGKGKVFWDLSEDIQINNNDNIYKDINSEDENTYYYLNNLGDSISLTLGNSEIFPLHFINTDNSGPGFGFYIYCEKESKEQNYHNLNYDKSTLISFKDIDFPFIFYTKLPDKLHEVYIDIKLNDFKYKSSYSTNYLNNEEIENEIPLYNEFIINGTVVDEEFIYKKKNNSELIPDTNKIISGKYDPTENIFKIQFTPDIIKSYNIDGNNYLYININKGNNKKIYTETTMECNVLLSNNDGYYTDINKYIYGKIPYQQIGYMRYELNRVNSLYKYMRIEFGSNSNKISFSINVNKPDDTIDYYKNNTDFIFNEYYNGKSVLIIEFKEDNIKSVYLSIFDKDNSHINNEKQISNFIFKYEIKENNDFIKIKPEKDEILSYKYIRSVVNITLPNIIGIPPQSQISYLAKLIPIDKYVQNENLYSIALIESESIKTFKKIENNLNTIQNLELVDIHNDTFYYIVINCEVKENTFEEKFSFKYIYNPTKYQKEEEKSHATLVAVIIVISLLGVVAIGFVIVFLSLKKTNLKKSIKLQELNKRLNDSNVL